MAATVDHDRAGWLDLAVRWGEVREYVLNPVVLEHGQGENDRTAVYEGWINTGDRLIEECAESFRRLTASGVMTSLSRSSLAQDESRPNGVWWLGVLRECERTPPAWATLCRPHTILLDTLGSDAAWGVLLGPDTDPLPRRLYWAAVAAESENVCRHVLADPRAWTTKDAVAPKRPPCYDAENYAWIDFGQKRYLAVRPQGRMLLKFSIEQAIKGVRDVPRRKVMERLGLGLQGNGKWGPGYAFRSPKIKDDENPAALYEKRGKGFVRLRAEVFDRLRADTA